MKMNDFLDQRVTRITTAGSSATVDFHHGGRDYSTTSGAGVVAALREGIRNVSRWERADKERREFEAQGAAPVTQIPGTA